ncbi:MBG domain-containing protein [Algoriphagus vanfongensis]|uniref:MBG domain-containing protein n=1 Tax=Algoriphagus vanfongensis TaxID=426371 RepID=UPI000405C400|nr:MBG domain-containing protein [Algoriphagus vanfongensis]
MNVFRSCYFYLLVLLFACLGNGYAQTTVTFNEITGSTGASLNSSNTYDNSGVRFQIFSGSNSTAWVSSTDNGFNGTKAIDDNNTIGGGVTGWKITKVDGSDFQLLSIWLQNGCPECSASGTVKAYKNGSQVGTTVNVDFNGVKNFAANPDFYDIDEVRIEGADLYVYIDNFTFGPSYIPVDGDPPVVSTIALVGTPLTTATTVDYTVTFSKNAKNVTPDDFQVTTAGTVGTVSAVSGSGNTYTVTVNGIDGEGTIRLDLKAGTDIANDDDITGTPAFTLGQLHYVGECFVETFETETDEATSFSGNGLNFTLGTGLKIEKRAGFGAGPSNGYIANNFTAGTFSLSSGTEFTMKTIDLFLSDQTNGNNPTGTGTIVITGKKGGVDQYTITKSSGFPTTTTTNNGYFTLDFATDGVANYRDTNVDELVFTISGGFTELAIDNMNFCEAAPEIDGDAPAVNSILKVGNPISTASSVDFQVTFDENASNVSMDDFELVLTGTATGAITGISGSGSVYTLNVTGITGEGSIQVKLLAGTDIADDLNNTPPFEFVNGELHLVGACYIENFETFLDGITAFTSNGVDVTLGGNWSVNERNGYGINSSDVYVENTGSGTYEMDLSEPVRISQIAFYLSSESGSSPNPTNDGALTIRGIRNGATSYTITKSAGFPTDFSSNNGFFYIDFSSEGGADNSNTYVDGLEIEIGGSFVYMALDNLQFCSDYTPPTVTLSVTPDSRSESVATTTEVRATLSGPVTENVLVSLGFSGTATRFVDYSVSGTTITIAPGNTSGSVFITNIQDALYEGNETVDIDITTVANADEDGTQEVTYTIEDDEPQPSVILELLDIYNPMVENGGQAFVRAKIGAVAGVRVEVPLSFSGTATGGGTDYAITGTNIIISPGETMDSIRVTSLFDGIEEGDETVIIDMLTPTNAVEIGTQQVTLTITDEDASAPTGYAVAIDQDPITPTNSSNVSFSFTDAEIGTTYNYLFTSSAGGTVVSGSGTISSTNQTISTLDLSGMADGTITLSVDLTDSFNNTGATVNDTAEKLASNPPFLTGLPTDISVVEGVASNIDLSGTTFGDLDAASDDVLEISYLVSGGALAFNSVAGITISQPIPGTWKTSGTISNLNSYLSDPASIKFTSSAGVVGDDAGSIALTGSDGTVGASFGSINIDVREIPSVTSVSVPANGIYSASMNLDFVVNYSEAVTVSGTPSFELTVGSTVYEAEYVSGSGTSALLFRYTVQLGDLDPNGISVGSIISLNGGSIQNSFGIDAELNLNSVESTTAVLVDAVAPLVFAIDRLTPLSGITNADVVTFRVIFSEEAFAVNSGDFSVTGPTGASIGVSGSGAVYDITVSGGNLAILNGVVDLNFAGGQNITDLAGNALVNTVPTGANNNEYTLDNTAPTVTALSPGDNATDVSLNSDFVITFNEDVVANSGNLTVHRVSDDGVVRNFDVTNGALVSIAGGVVTFTNTSDLNVGTEYYVILDNGAFQDEAGNAFGGIVNPSAWNFTTSVQTQLSVNDPTVTEGNSGTTQLIFLVSLSQPAPAGGATVDYATSNGTATAGSDYIAASGTLSFSVGESSKTINISITGDEVVELDETFTLTLSNPTGTNVSLGDFDGIGTIQNDDTAAVTISDVSGNEDDGVITLTATLDKAVQDGFTVDVSTSDGTATVADNDYTAVIGQTLTFVGTAGETQTFTVTPTLDLVIESDETVSVSQSNLAGTSLTVDISDGATVTILNDDSAPSGYTVAWDDLLINAIEAPNTSFTVSGAEVGATIFYSISSAGDGNTSNVLGSTAVVDPNQVVTADVRTLVDGALTVEVYLQDAGGNNGVSTSDNSAVLDQTAPLAPSAPDLAPSSDTGLSSSDNITADNTPTITGTAEPNSIVTLYRDNITVLGSTTVDGAGNWTFTSPVIPDGVYVISTDATDEAGNTSPKSAGVSITFDTTSPVTPSIPDLEASSDTGASDSDNISSNSTPTFIGTAEAGSMVKLYSGANLIGTSTATGGNWAIVSSTLAEGTHQITATATDVAGNISVPSSALQIEIDTQAPAAPSVPDLTPGSDSGISDSDNITNDLMPTFTGVALASSKVQIISDVDGALGETTADGSGDWTFTPVSSMTSGLHSITVTQTDLAGNESPSSPALSVVLDNSAPSAVIRDNYIIVLDSDGNSTLAPSEVVLSLVDDYSAVGDIVVELSRDTFDCSLVGTGSLTTYVTDQAGNTNSYPSTILVQDNTPPTILAKSAITLNVDAFGTVTLTPAMIDKGSTDACGIQSQVLSQTLFDRTDEGVNNITYTVTDVNGNPSQVNVAVTIVVVPKVLNVTVDAGQSKVYGSADPVFTYTATGFEAGDDETILIGALARATGEDVGTYAVSQGTLDAGPNYSINFFSTDFEIMPANLAITADAGQSKIYGSLDPVLTYQAAGFKNGDNESVLTGALSRAAGENVGAYAINLGTLDAGANYTINFTGATFAITPATVTGITFDDASFVFDGTAKSLAITGTLPTGTSVSYSNNSRTDVGTQEVTATISGSNYTTLVLTADLTITPATVTGITFDDASFVFDGTAKSLAITGTLPTGTSVNYSNNTRTDVGTQEVTATITGSNFTTLVLTADLTITPATVTGITFDDASFVFDGTTKSLAITGTLPTGTSVSYSNNSRTDVGTQEVTATIAGSNFTTLILTADLTITPATLSITADAGQSKIYGEADPAFTYTASGFGVGDDESILTGALARATGENVGMYAINIGTLDAGANYTISYTGADFNITPATLTIIADSGQTKVYGSTDPVFTYEVTGYQNGDTETILTGALARAAGENVGMYAINRGTLDAGANYTISYTGADFEISPATLTIIADAGQSKVYGSADPVFTYDVTGYKNGDTESILTGTLARVAGEDVDMYAINLGTLDAGANYTISYTGADFEITPATLTIIADSGQTKVYGSTDPVFTYEVIGYQNGDTESILTGALARAAGEDVDMYAINLGTLDAGANYTINFTSADFAITPRTLSITANSNQAKVYGSVDPILSYSASNFGNGDNASILTGALSRVAGEDVGMYAITIGTLDAGANYILNFTSADFEIAEKVLDVTADGGQSKVFGTADPTLSYQVIGFENGDDTSILTGALARAAGENVGSYPISLGTLDAGANYAINYTGASFTITKATITGITFDDASFVYDGTAKSLAITGTLPAGTSVSYANNSRTDVGTQEVTATISGSNFMNLELTADLTITPATITGITLDDASFVFDGTSKSLAITGTLPAGTSVSYANNSRTDVGTQEVTATITGSNFTTLELKADLTITPASVQEITLKDQIFEYDGLAKFLSILGNLPEGVSVSFANNGQTVAGVYEVVATLTGANFEELILKANLTITSKEIQVMADSGQGKTQGESDPVLTYSYSGLADGDGMEVFSGVLSRAAGEAVGSYAITQGTLSAGANYTIDFTGADFQISEKPDNDSDGDGVPDQEEEQDGTDPTDPYDFKDTDGDGVPDYVEEQEGTDSEDPTDYQDTDEDQVPDYVEEQQGTDPDNPDDAQDSDEDGVPDYLQERSITELITQSMQVAWNTPEASLNLPAEAVALTGKSAMVNVPVSWNLTGYDPLQSGTASYEGTISAISGLFNTYGLKAELTIEVLAKPAPTDVTLSESEFIGDPDATFQTIGTFTVIDATDDQHTLSLPEGQGDNELFEVIDDILYWSSEDERAGETQFEVVLQVEDRGGNVISKTFQITRLRTPLDELELTNTFTPNADGVNDSWGVPALRYYQGVRIQVFDRGGQRLFYTEDADVRWDGRSEGREMPVGAYYWVIEVGETGEVRRGILNLLRQ